MTSNRKAKKMSAKEAHRAVNRQFYRRQEVLDYPDIIHVKNDDPHRSDVVCLRTFGQAYMDVVPHPATTEDDYQTTQYVRPRMLAKAWRERIFDAIDRLKRDETLQFAGFGHEFDHCSVSQSGHRGIIYRRRQHGGNAPRTGRDGLHPSLQPGAGTA